MVKIRELKKSDSKRLASLLNNKKIWDNLRDYTPYSYTEKDTVEYIDFCNLKNWGKGITSKVVQLIFDYGFKRLNIVRIYTGIFNCNIAFQKVLINNGFVKEGVFKNAIFKNGKLCDEVRFAIIKEGDFCD